MANTSNRNFNLVKADKEKLRNANPKGGACPNLNTEFALTGKFDIQNGWFDQKGQPHNEEREYAYFEGTRNQKPVPAGLSAGIFLRRPFDGFTDDESKSLTDFHRKLLDCISAEDFFDLCEAEGVFSGKRLVVSAVVRHNERPFGQDTEKPVRYAIFDLK